MQFIKWLAAAMGDGDSPSSSRLVAVPSLLAVYLVPLFAWLGLSIYKSQILEMPGSVTGFTASVSAPLLVFLHWNKRVENNVVTP